MEQKSSAPGSASASANATHRAFARAALTICRRRCQVNDWNRTSQLVGPDARQGDPALLMGVFAHAANVRHARLRGLAGRYTGSLKFCLSGD